MLRVAGAWITAAGALAGMLAGCGGSGSGGTATSRQVAGPVCSSAPKRPDGPGTEVAGRVFFFGYATPGWRQGSRLQSDPYPGQRWFSKAPIAVRGTAPVRLRIPQRARSVYMRGFSPHDSRDVTIEQRISGPCADQSWRRHPGGYLYRKAQCLSLRVEADGRVATVPIGLRRTCPR